MSEALQFDFMRNALWAGLLVSIACGIIGTFVVINRLVFISGGIAHAGVWSKVVGDSEKRSRSTSPSGCPRMHQASRYAKVAKLNRLV